MDNFDYIEYLRNNPLLNEIKVNNPTQLSKEDIKHINDLTEFFAEGTSGFELNEPLDEEYELENFEDEDGNDERKIALEKLIYKYPTDSSRGRMFVTNELDISKYFYNNSAPKNSFQARVIIYKDSINVAVPYIDENGEGSVGWFDTSGEYYGDTKHYDEKGNRIKDGGEN
jgi:hypothetical protein